MLPSTCMTVTGTRACSVDTLISMGCSSTCDWTDLLLASKFTTLLRHGVYQVLKYVLTLAQLLNSIRFPSVHVRLDVWKSLATLGFEFRPPGDDPTALATPRAMTDSHRDSPIPVTPSEGRPGGLSRLHTFRHVARPEYLR